MGESSPVFMGEPWGWEGQKRLSRRGREVLVRDPEAGQRIAETHPVVS